MKEKEISQEKSEATLHDKGGCDLPTWIHGDEDATCLAELDFPSLKQKPLGIIGERLQNGQDLLSHHR